MALKSQNVSSFSAAARVINASERVDGDYLRGAVASGRAAGRNLWDYYDEIGEVHYALDRTARIAGYGRLLGVLFGADGEVEEEIDAGEIADVVEGIYSKYGGLRGFIERYYTLLKVPGDMYLVDLDDDGYHLASPDELNVAGFSRFRRNDGVKSLALTTLPSTGEATAFKRDLRPDQLIGRIWAPSKRFVDMPESALGALRTECEVLRDLTLSMKSLLRSRFALAGILFLPPGVSMARTAKKANRIAGQLPDDTLNLIIAAMTRNVKRYDDATTRLPLILKGANAEDGEKIRHILLDHSIADTDLKLRAELIERILQGLDSNQDNVRGASTMSHFQAWSAADDERRVAVGPDLESLCWSLTRLVLNRKLEKPRDPKTKALMATGRVGIWYDLSRAAARSNQQEDARQAWDRILIGDKPARRLSGIPERDKPTEDEYVRGIGRLTKNPYLMAWGTESFDKIDWELVKATGVSSGPAPNSPADEPEAGPGEGDPGSPDDRETDTPRTERPV